MKQPKATPAISFLLLFTWHCISSGELVDGEMVTFHIKNKCPFPIWPASTPTAGYPVISNNSFLLLPDQTKLMKTPSTWIGRFWARTGCNFTCPSSTNIKISTCPPKPACETGDCESLLECNGAIGLPPATLIQVSIQEDKSMPNFYGISLVDGYNLPISMSTKSSDPDCTISGCKKSINHDCPKDLQVLDKSGKVVACKSACLAFKEDKYCCMKPYGTPETCKHNKYSKLFKDACPSYISYAFDSPMPLKNCSSKDYDITFCPSKWSALQPM